MIYRREEFIQENPDNEHYPVKTIETLTSLDGAVTKYIGRVSIGIQTPMGVSSLPISFEIDAAAIAEAFEKFEARAETEIVKAKEELQQQMQEMRRKAQSRIVTPGEMPPGGPGSLRPPTGGLTL